MVATHVPPFSEAAFYAGQTCSPKWLPFLSIRSVGDVLLAAAPDNPNHRIVVLCGHAQGEGFFRPRPNLEVRVAGPSMALHVSPTFSSLVMLAG